MVQHGVGMGMGIGMGIGIGMSMASHRIAPHRIVSRKAIE